MAALSQQISLRISDEHRARIRAKLEELRRASDDPDSVTEADAARALLAEGPALEVAR